MNSDSKNTFKLLQMHLTGVNKMQQKEAYLVLRGQCRCSIIIVTITFIMCQMPKN